MGLSDGSVCLELWVLCLEPLKKGKGSPTPPPPEMKVFPNIVWGGEKYFLYSLQNEFANPKQNTVLLFSFIKDTKLSVF